MPESLVDSFEAGPEPTSLLDKSTFPVGKEMFEVGLRLDMVFDLMKGFYEKWLLLFIINWLK